METESITLGLAVVVPLLTGGAVFGSIRAALNGTKKQVASIVVTVGAIDERTRGNEITLARVEQRQVDFEQRLDRAEA